MLAMPFSSAQPAHMLALRHPTRRRGQRDGQCIGLEGGVDQPAIAVAMPGGEPP